jgi:hypothetical protein
MIFTQLTAFHKHFIPIKITQTVEKDQITGVLKQLKAPEDKIVELGSAIRLASSRTGIDAKLIAVLMHTESGFNTNAVSKKKYKGLMQTPTVTHFSDVDVLHGAYILKDKLRITGGDMREALTLYKGGRNKVAREQASQVLEIYEKVI